MKTSTQLCTHALLFCMLFSSVVHAEALDDRSSSISPKHSPGAGEFLHGTGYGKLMMRVLVMGAVPAQGIHYVPEGTDLMFALLYCGGKTEQTDLEDITIRRRGVRDLIEIDLADLTEEGRPVPKLHDGDLITVGYNWRKNYNTFLTITGVFTSITGFLLSLVALTK